MSKLKHPVELTAAIYNSLVKVFNDASNGIDRDGRKNDFLLKCRDQIIEARKQFPTYQELKDSGIKFVDSPSFEDPVTKEQEWVYSWIGTPGVENDASHGNVLDASVIYYIEFIMATNPINFQPIVVLKVRGVPDPERFGVK